MRLVLLIKENLHSVLKTLGLAIQEFVLRRIITSVVKFPEIYFRKYFRKYLLKHWKYMEILEIYKKLRRLEKTEYLYIKKHNKTKNAYT